MAKPTAQQCHAMTTYFIKAYTEVNGKQPVVNRNKARWGFEALLMDYTSEQVRSMIDHFVAHFDKDLEWFLWNYEKVDAAMQEHEQNKVSIARKRKITQERLDRWRELNNGRRG